jgi:hypothetical protein
VSTAATSKNGKTSERIVSGETAQFDDPLSYSSNFARVLFVLRTRGGERDNNSERVGTQRDGESGEVKLTASV